MAIITRDKVKCILNIDSSDTTYDDLIDCMIPIVQEDVLTYLCNDFLNISIQYGSDTIAFSGNSITDSDSEFVNEEFIAGDYKVEGSKFNNGFYTVTNVTAGTLTVSEDLTTEAADNDITLTFVQYPTAIQRIIAMMIGWQISYKSGIKSETFSRYSITYGSDTQKRINGYPDTITQGLNKWKKCWCNK